MSAGGGGIQLMWDRNLVSLRPKPLAVKNRQMQLFDGLVTKRLARVYHHYEQWEEFRAGMWRGLSGKEAGRYLKEAIAFTGDAILYGSYMRRVIVEWPISCENSLTCISLNRQAWVGHAACCLALGCPEHITREAWHHLSETQREEANDQAAQAITLWEERYLNA